MHLEDLIQKRVRIHLTTGETLIGTVVNYISYIELDSPTSDTFAEVRNSKKVIVFYPNITYIEPNVS